MAQRINETQEQQLLRPLLSTGKAFYVFAGAALILILLFLYAWYIQLTKGLGVTGLDTPVGATWGIYLTNFIFFIGITHAGIAIASAIRLLKLKDYIPIARMAELITIFSLMMAGLSIVLDMGRPDRIFNIMLNYSWRLGSSPLIWDITAVAIYLIFAVTYLYMEMREDLARLAGKVRWGWLYRYLLPAYKHGEREKAERIIFWASIFNFPIMVMVHTTVAWIFGLMVSRPGWYSAILGPYYVVGAVLSGIAAVVVLTAIYRQLFHWQELIKPTVFRGMGRFLSWFCILYLYFLLAEFITVKFAGTAAELNVSMLWSHQEYAWYYWSQVIALVIAFTIFFINTVFPKVFRIGTTVFAAALVVVTLWLTRFLIVVPSLLRPFLPFPTGSYTPTWVEWSIVIGTFSVVFLLFMLFTKVFPIIPITEMEKTGKEE